MKRKIMKLGGSSLGIRIPKALLDLLNLKAGSEVTLSIKKDSIVIEKGE